jgi:hypothetical protein
MNDTNAEVEAVLHATYVQEADCYALALQRAGELVAACERGEPIDDRLRSVLDLLDEVAGHETRIAVARQHWEQGGRFAGVELRSVRERIAALITQLSRQLQRIEQMTRERRDRLAVELDACNRRHQMQRAYARES